MSVQLKVVGFVACTVIFNIGAVSAEGERPPTMEEMKRLSKLVFDEPKESGDVTVLRTVHRATVTIDPAVRKKTTVGIREAETAIANQDRARGRVITDEELEQRISNAVSRWESQQSKDLVLKQRVRVDQFRYRLDQVTSNDVPVVNADTEFVDTYVNMGNPLEEDYNNFHISVNNKHAFRDNRQGTRWAQLSVLDLAGVSVPAEMAIKGSMCSAVDKDGKKTLKIDPDKIERVSKGVDPDTMVFVTEFQKNGIDHVKLSVGINGATLKAVGLSEPVVISELTFTDNFNRCIEEVVYNFRTKKPVAKMTRSNFSKETDIPSVVKRITYGPDTKVASDEDILVLSYNLTKVPDEVFAYAPPDGYHIVDNRPGMRKAETPTPQSSVEPLIAKPEFRWWWLMIANCVVAGLIAAIALMRKRGTNASQK